MIMNEYCYSRQESRPGLCNLSQVDKPEGQETHVGEE